MPPRRRQRQATILSHLSLHPCVAMLARSVWAAWRPDARRRQVQQDSGAFFIQGESSEGASAWLILLSRFLLTGPRGGASVEAPNPGALSIPAKSMNWPGRTHWVLMK